MILNDRTIFSEDVSLLNCTRHFPDNSTEVVTTTLNSEHKLELFSGGKLLHSFNCTPAALGELCTGWLLCEGLMPLSVSVSQDGVSAECTFSDSDIAFFPQKSIISPFEMLDRFISASEKYNQTHGIHECVLKCGDHVIVRCDISRSYAVCKAVGAAFLQNLDLKASVVFTSGRINRQLVDALKNCGISNLMSKSVISLEACELASSLGMSISFSVSKNGYFTI